MNHNSEISIQIYKDIPDADYSQINIPQCGQNTIQHPVANKPEPKHILMN